MLSSEQLSSTGSPGNQKYPAHPVPTILYLPSEIIIQILASLSGMRYLLPVILTHRTFNTVFKEHRQYILQGILSQQVPYRLLSLAVATHKATKVIHQTWDADHDFDNWEAICGLLDEAFAQPSPSTPFRSMPVLAPKDVIVMEKTQAIIDYFVDDFASRALPRFKGIFADIEIGTREGKCTEMEKDRLYRAFYRFQLYSRTFGRKALAFAIGGVELVSQAQLDETHRRILELFFRPWSPWANEQLACVFQYLDEKVATAFNEVAERDLEWAYCQINWVEPGAAAENRHYLLHFGLTFVHALNQATNYDTCKRIIDMTDFPWFGGHIDELRIPSFLQDSTPQPTGGVKVDVALLSPLGTSTTDELEKLAQSTAWQGVDGVDSLPVYLWLHAHYNCAPGVTVNAEENLLLRDAGYVFWDGPREETLQLLERLDRYKWTFEGRLPPDELAVKVRAMRESWVMRTEIYLRNYTPRRWPGNMPGW